MFWFGGIVLGCHHFVKASYECTNKTCKRIQAQGRAEFMRLGAWPGTPVQLDCVIDISVFERWRRHKYHGAPVSLEAFIKELHEEGEDYGAEVYLLCTRFNFILLV